MKLKSFLPVVLTAVVLFGCSMQKMAGEAVLEYTHDKAIPYLMSQGDLQAACGMGQSMGPILASLSKIELDPANITIATYMASGMCAEFEQRSAELDRVRALFDNRTTAARDALIREKHGHRLAAIRMFAGYENAVKTYGTFDSKCRSYDNDTDELLSLLGLASGALALLHDFNSEKSVGIPLDVPGVIERSMKCFSDDKWWGMPTALRASLWLSIPGAGPEGVDPLEEMQKAALKGDKQGVLLARAMLAMMAANVGKPEIMCRAIAEMPDQSTLNRDYDMLNAYARSILTHQADLVWTRQKGHRAPFMQPACPDAGEPSSIDQSQVDELLDGLLDDEENTEPDVSTPDTAPGLVTRPQTSQP